MDISPRWSTNTKFIVMLAILAIVGLSLIRLQFLIAPVILAVMTAYLLNPAVNALTKYLRLPRAVAALAVYAVLILLLVTLIGGAGLLLQQEFSGVLATFLTFVNSIPAWINTLSAKPVSVGPFTFDLSSADISVLQNALLPAARDSIGRITGWMTGAASGVASFLGWAVFVFTVSIYLILDMDALQKSILRMVPEDYKQDAGRLLAKLGPIWNAYLRGQLVLGLIIGSVVTVTMSFLGVRYALILGLIAALMDFIPILGWYLAVGTEILVAMFQPSNWLGLSPITFTIVVAIAALVLQQIKISFFIPRVMQTHLKVHPVVLIIGVLIGATLLGFTGLLLSAPIIATASLFGKYVRAKLFNLQPWEDLETQRIPSIPAPPVRIRPARKSDTGDVLALTARMWEGHDYIPRVWSDWLADRSGILAVAERDGKAVGIGKLTRMTPEEWWLEGLRVHPEYQGLKIGSQLFEYLVEGWKKRGGGAIRLATSSERVPVHHLCGRLGFRRVETFLLMAAAPTAQGESAFEPIAEADVPAALAFAEKATSVRNPSHLVNTGWRWGRLTENRLREFIRRGHAWWWKDRAAVLLLYDAEYENKPSLEIAAVLSSPGIPAAMLGQARRLAGRMGAARLAWAMPNLPAVAAAARRAGFKQELDAQLWMFERTDPQVAEQTSESDRIAAGHPIETNRTRRTVQRPTRTGALSLRTMNDRAASRAVSKNETPKNIRSKLRGIPHPAKAG
jgi:predicted PurR-regulated permease PerM/GNAT superfamily N-acetyltransferase